MPISHKLSHVDAATAAMQDFTKRKLSTEDMYRHAVLAISHNLQLLAKDIIDYHDDANMSIMDTLKSTEDAMRSAIERANNATSRQRQYGSTVDTDLKLAAYGTLRDCVSTLYRDHPGLMHDTDCRVCRCLWLCAGMVAAVERYLTTLMAQAQKSITEQSSGRPSHRAVPVAITAFESTVFEVTCPECGVLSTFPQREGQRAHAAAVAHRRAMRIGGRVITRSVGV